MIDTSAWKEFRVGDLFDMSLSKDDIQPKSTVEGDIPLISSGKTNNGIVAYIQDDKATIQKADTITVDMFGKAFYQANSYYCVSHGRVNILTPKFDINEYIGLFVASVIEKVSNEKYEFNSMCTGKKLAEDIVSLPATSDGQPDWDYMESYMKAVMEESEKSLENLRKVDDTKHLIDVSGWGEFRMEDIFDVIKGTRLTKADMKDGTIKFVGSSAMNNGETHRIENNEKLHPANTITVCYNGSVGETFYQDEIFWASDDVNVLYPKFDMTKLMAMFICPIIKSVGQKYAFIDKWKQEDMKNETIRLPITSTGEPDWQYMEDYMRKIMDKSQQIISDLQIGV